VVIPLWVPKEVSKGMIVFFTENRDTTNKTTIIELALKNQLAVLFATTDNPVEFFLKNQK
jgi:hypothetical protein